MFQKCRVDYILHHSLCMGAIPYNLFDLLSLVLSIEGRSDCLHKLAPPPPPLANPRLHYHYQGPTLPASQLYVSLTGYHNLQHHPAPHCIRSAARLLPADYVIMTSL